MKISCTKKLASGTFVLSAVCAVGGIYIWPLWMLAGVSFGVTIGLCCLRPRNTDYPIYSVTQQPVSAVPLQVFVTAASSAPNNSPAASAEPAPLDPPAILLAYRKSKSQNHVKAAMSISVDFPQFRKMSL